MYTGAMGHQARMPLTHDQESPCGTVIFLSHNWECSLASPDACQSLHTHAALKMVTELWNIQRLAQMPKNLYTKNCRTRDAGQDSTWDCSDANTDCLTSRQTV